MSPLAHSEKFSSRPQTALTLGVEALELRR